MEEIYKEIIEKYPHITIFSNKPVNINNRVRLSCNFDKKNDDNLNTYLIKRYILGTIDFHNTCNSIFIENVQEEEDIQIYITIFDIDISD